MKRERRPGSPFRSREEDLYQLYPLIIPIRRSMEQRERRQKKHETKNHR